MSVKLGLDFGARFIKIYKDGEGIVLREPNVAAVDTGGNVIAVGTDAIMLSMRAPGTVTLRNPFEGGVISDFNLTAELLDIFLERVAPKTKKHIMVAIKYSKGTGSREILRSALGDCNTGKITLVDSALAALKGCNVEENHTDEYNGILVCDVGASIVEVAYVRRGELMRADSSLRGGDYADLEICSYLRRKYDLAVMPAAARDAKHRLSLMGENEGKVMFSGVDIVTGMPSRKEVTLEELLPPCQSYIDGVASLIRTASANLPVHGENESRAEQLVLIGGGADMPGFAEYIADTVGYEIILPPSLTDCVALGLGVMMQKK